MQVIRLGEIPGLTGRVYVGREFCVTLEERDAFDEVTGVNRAYPDPDPPEFPKGILEGFHTLALVDAITRGILRFDPATTYALNYGLDRVRFTSPVPVETGIVPGVEVVRVRARGDGCVVLLRCTFTVKGEVRPALVADWLVCVRPRVLVEDTTERTP